MKKNQKMKLVRQIIYKRSDPEYNEMDELCFKSKNLYNATLYAVRQSFIKSDLKNSVQLGNVAVEIFLLDKKELIENILNKKEKEKIFEKVYESYKRNQKNIAYEFYSDNFHNIISDLNILKEYFKEETNMSIEDLNNGGFVNDALVFYSLEIAKREYFGKNISVKELYNFVKGYNSNDELWEDFYDFLKEDEIKRIKETTESIAEEVKYLLETDEKAIHVSEILEEQKDIFNSQEL